MDLMNFQLKAIKSLLECMEDDSVREIVLKSHTGSGKTIMLTHFMDEYTKEHAKTVFVWLTRAKAIWKRKARRNWTCKFITHRQNCLPT